MLHRRMFLAGALAALAACAAPAPAETMQVYKSPSCGCCALWVDHVRKAGFTVAVKDMDNLAPITRRLGVPDHFRSCHTATMGGYFIEGHVPAADIRKLLKERPEAAGVAIPGMLVGPPGMEQPGRDQSYSTLLIDRTGHPRVFAVHSI